MIEADGGQAIFIPADVKDQKAVEGAVTEVERQLGPIDLLVNNAGVPSPGGSLWGDSAEVWWNVIEVNLRGPFLCCRAVLPGMVARRRGRIINISSRAAYSPLPYGSSYCASKAALANMTASLAGEVNDFGISVFAYAPGTVRTAATEYLAGSPRVHRSLRELFGAVFAEGRDTPIGAAVDMLMFMASGRADALSGHHLSVDDDEADLLDRTDEILGEDLYRLSLPTKA